MSDIDNRVVTQDVAAVGGQRVDVASEELVEFDELVGQEGLFGVGDLSATAAHGGTDGTLAVGFVEPVVDRDAGGRSTQQRAAPRIVEWSSIVRPCRRSTASV